MLLAKAGLFGSTLFFLLFLNLPKNIFTLAAILIMGLSAFGGGSPFFGLDGCYLILWLALIEAKNRGAVLAKRTAMNSSVPEEPPFAIANSPPLKGFHGRGIK